MIPLKPLGNDVGGTNNLYDNDAEDDSGDDGAHDDPDDAQTKKKKKKPSFRYVVWDTETAQDFDQNSELMTLEVNCVAARLVCSFCQHSDGQDPCSGCGTKDRDVCFMGADAMNQFCLWLFEPSLDDDDRVPTTAFAHNFRSFDGIPLLRWLHNQNIVPSLIMNGCKIMGLELVDQKTKFLDSLNFLPMSLRAMPKALGLSDVLRKGEFPHRLNRMSNMGKVFDTHPPLSYYDPGNVIESTRVELEEWHKSVRLLPFNFNKELSDYCRTDVAVLMAAVLAFRDIFMQVTTFPTKSPKGIDPFESSLTIAGACNRVFRLAFLEPNTVALIPSEGYDPTHKQSVEALQWLIHLSDTDPDHAGIRHAKNGPEINIPSIGKVDGFRQDPYTNEPWVYEFHVSIYITIIFYFVVNSYITLTHYYLRGVFGMDMIDV